MNTNDNLSSSPDPTAWITESRLVREWRQMKQHILEHKWYESEKAGCDVGWEKASVDWLIHHNCKRK